ncbi:MAG: hypothetical protein JNL10_15415 [Verrucomicrobiales bacterium]|nr:hypothetical protein [Verrucomicrobiales bacterium]
MSTLDAPRMPRWPFVIADALLLAAAAALVLHGNRPLALHEVVAVAALCALGAWIMILPFLRDHAAAVKLQEQAGLADTARQIGDLQTVAAHIREATAQWQSIHDGARKASETATGAVERVGAEAKAFTEFLSRSNDQEKQALRLELEKLRRGGTEHLQVIVHVLDHVHALYQASARNGATPLTAQLGQFRGACLDAVRRIGLASYEAKPGDPFDGNVHQTPEGREPAPGSRIASTIACGYSFQGQPVRRILVTVDSPESEPEAAGAAPEGESRTVREVADDPALELPLGDNSDV